MEEGMVAVRLRSGADLKAMPVDAVIDRIRTEVKTRQDTRDA
jgi:hypothetical protein